MTEWSDPDPADVPDDGAEVSPEFDAVVGEEEGVALVDARASCFDCAHFEVCAIFAGIRPMMQDWHTDEEEEAEAPIDIEKLAWHCKQYEPTGDDEVALGP